MPVLAKDAVLFSVVIKEYGAFIQKRLLIEIVHDIRMQWLHRSIFQFNVNIHFGVIIQMDSFKFVQKRHGLLINLINFTFDSLGKKKILI